MLLSCRWKWTLERFVISFVLFYVPQDRNFETLFWLRLQSAVTYMDCTNWCILDVMPVYVRYLLCKIFALLMCALSRQCQTSTSNSASWTLYLRMVMVPKSAHPLQTMETNCNCISCFTYPDPKPNPNPNPNSNPNPITLTLTLTLSP
jgi:hypothetical protein